MVGWLRETRRPPAPALGWEVFLCVRDSQRLVFVGERKNIIGLYFSMYGNWVLNDRCNTKCMFWVM